MSGLEKFEKGLIKTNKTLKKYLVQTRGDECESCGLGNSWNGFYLCLTVDHIDGDNSNNIPSNLRLLCPNCHSQTLTFCGSNIKRSKSFRKYGKLENK